MRLVLGEKNAEEFKTGEIFVGFAMEPYTVEALSRASAVVLDVSETKQSPLHPAIVAGELGIPCVAKTRAATKVLKTGDRVVVDGDTGNVSLCSGAKQIT